MNRCMGSAAIVIVVVACGGGGDEAEVDPVEQLCDDAKDKAEECNQALDTSGGCLTDPGEDVICSVRCMVDADCDQLFGPREKNSYYVCQATCDGLGPDDFLCDDVSGFLSPNGECNGVPECPDGSDEAACS